MARRRMFSVELISSDRFLGLNASAQAFYFHLNLHADDEGFVAAPKSLGMLCGGTSVDLNALEEKNFIIRFDSGVLLITDWMLHNTIKKDRSMETIHRTERAMVTLVDKRYVRISSLQTAGNDMGTENDPENGTKNDPKNGTFLSANFVPQNRIEQNRKEYIRIDNSRTESPGGENSAPADGWDGDDLSMMNHKMPSCGDVLLYCEQEGLKDVDVTNFWSHYYLNGWKDKDGSPVQDWKALVRSWNQAANSS